MASPLRQRGDIQKSQRLVIPAEAFNGFVDAARAVREHKQFDTEPLAVVKENQT